MSIALMTHAWKVDLMPAQKLALLAMCDWANDDGGSLHPSISAIATRVGCSDRHAKRILRELMDDGWLMVVRNEFGGAPGQTRHYQINKLKLVTGDTVVTPTGDVHDTPKPRKNSRKTVMTGDTRVTPTGDTHVTGDKSGRVTPVSETGDMGVPRRVTPVSETGDMGVTQTTIEPSINHQGSTSNTARTRAATKKPHDVDEQVWADWQALRKARKSPITQTVIDTMRSEAGKAGISLQDAMAVSCANGWQGFRASWFAKDYTAGQPGSTVRVSKQQAIEASNKAIASEWLAQQQGVSP